MPTLRKQTMSAANYLERYFDCVDTMPRDLQRNVTRLREIELQHRRLLAEVDQLRLELDSAVARCDESVLSAVVGRLQLCMVQVREVGNLKLEVSSQLLDTPIFPGSSLHDVGMVFDHTCNEVVEDYTQQLTLSAKQLDSPRCHEDHHHHSPRHSYTNSYHHNGKGESPLVLQGEGGGEKQHSKRNSSAAKRPRSQLEKPREQEDSPPAVAGRSRENSTTGSMGAVGGGASGNKLPRKKIKTKKKTSKDSSALLPDPAHLPMPDLSSQPLDPNEPTYCLCNQVSFGEMIGCDNEECPIEWFHFQCVGLTSKPKGKWYCPQCTTERKTKSSK